MSQGLQVYPIYAVERPQIVRPSYLFSLEPIGLFTPYVESLTGYIIRLAQEHALSPQDLIVRFILPIQGRTYNSQAKYNMINSLWSRDSLLVNSAGSLAKMWKGSLEQLTLRQDIEYLTVLSWKNVIGSRSKLGFLSPFRRWCKYCYYEWKNNNQIIYEPLIWSLSAITMCPFHKAPLSSKCEFCGKSSSPLCQLSRVGYCYKCGCWLGASDIFSGYQTDDEQEWKNYVIESVGSLISVMPTIKNGLLEDGFAKSINAYCTVAGKGGGAELARQMKIEPESLWKLKNQASKPSLITALRLGYFLKIHILEIFINPEIGSLVKNNFDSGMISKPNLNNPLFQGLDYAQIKLIRNELELELSKDTLPTSSINDIARRLGYSSNTISKYGGGLASQILERNKVEFDYEYVRKHLDTFSQEMPPRNCSRLG